MSVNTPYPAINEQTRRMDDCAALMHEAVGAARALDEALIRMRLRFGGPGNHYWKEAYALIEELQQSYQDDSMTFQSEWVELLVGLATIPLKELSWTPDDVISLTESGRKALLETQAVHPDWVS